jgi:hypothetical protein
MQSLAATGIGVLIVVSMLVASRLLLLYRRTGGWPELLLGAMLLLSVGVGYPLMIAASQSGPTWSGRFVIVSQLAIAVGFSFLFAFTWRVFRPQATWAWMLAAAGLLVGLAKALDTAVHLYRHGAIDITDIPLTDMLWETLPVLVGYMWTAFESLRYHAAMRRRVKLGLADVTVSNRFLLWGLMALIATAGVALNIGAMALRVDVQNPGLLLASSVTGLGQALFLFLAFGPPRAYLAWVRGRAVAAGN